MGKQKTQTATEMEKSWLVQRLQKPRKPGLFGDNPFSFGGGLHNGGLTSQAMDALRGVFSFDYMGAAEFEWGAVPKALSGLAKDADSLKAFSFDVPLADVPPDWRVKDAKAPEGTAPVYVLCRAEHAVEVEERVSGWTREQYPRLKEPLHLTGALRPHNDWDLDRCGWLELDNGFLFFTDRDMWAATCGLFGVEVAEVAA